MLKTFLTENNIPFLENESLKKHTTFKVGGEAKYIALPEDKFQAVELLKFIRENGIRMSNKEPYKHLHLILNEYNDKVLEYLKLPLLRVHDLRHTCATLMLASGVDPVTVSAILGHKDTTTTFKIYAHPLESNKKKAIDVLERVLTV
jgi:integrase